MLDALCVVDEQSKEEEEHVACAVHLDEYC